MIGDTVRSFSCDGGMSRSRVCEGESVTVTPVFTIRVICEMMESRDRSGEENMRRSLLVIDDEQMILDAIQVLLEDMGYEVHAATDPAEGIAAATARHFDLILTDIRMPVFSGAEITKAIRAARPDARVLVMTGFPDDPLVRRALDAGAIGIVRKPFEIAVILDFLKE